MFGRDEIMSQLNFWVAELPAADVQSLTWKARLSVQFAMCQRGNGRTWVDGSTILHQM